MKDSTSAANMIQTHSQAIKAMLQEPLLNDSKAIDYIKKSHSEGRRLYLSTSFYRDESRTCFIELVIEGKRTTKRNSGEHEVALNYRYYGSEKPLMDETELMEALTESILSSEGIKCQDRSTDETEKRLGRLYDASIVLISKYHYEDD